MRERRPRAPPVRAGADAGGRGREKASETASPLRPVRGAGRGRPRTTGERKRVCLFRLTRSVSLSFIFSDQTMNRFAFQLRELVLCIFLMFTVFTASVVSQAVASGGALFLLQHRSRGG